MASLGAFSGSVTSLCGSESGGAARCSPPLCDQHLPPAVCSDRLCEALHVCRLYADGFCPRADDACPWGHSVSDSRNQAALQRYRLIGLPEQQLLWLARALVRQTCPVSDAEYHQLLHLCHRYSSDAGCGEPACFQLHLCPRLARGRCPVGEDDCPWNHQVASCDNLMVLLRLRCADMPERQVLKLLRANLERCLGDNVSSTAGSEVVTESADSSATFETASLEVSPNSITDMLNKESSQAEVNSSTSAQPRNFQVVEEAASAGTVTASLTSGNSTDTRQQHLQELVVCRKHCYPSKCGAGDSCANLHLCRYVVADMCPYTSKCVRDHRITKSAHNQRVLAAHQLSAASDQQVLAGLRANWLRQNPITRTERHFLLQLCRPYMNDSKCDSGCARLHLCEKYAYGTCTGRCRHSHEFNSPRNAIVLRRLGLTGLAPSQLKDIVTSKVPSKNVWDSWEPGQNEALLSGASGVSMPRQQPQTPRKGTVNYAKAVKAAQPSPSRPVQAPSAVPRPATESGACGDSPRHNSGDSLAAEIEAELSISTDREPGICTVHAAGATCSDVDCANFHICGYFLANLCRRGDAHCADGHSFQTDHNVAVMSRYGLIGGSAEDFQALLDRITLGSRITFKNDAQVQVKMCIPYNSPGGCENEGCSSFHICNRYLAGTCKKGGADGCGRIHDLKSKQNQKVWRAIKLRRCKDGGPVGDWATDEDILKLLRAKLGIRSNKPSATKPQSHSVSQDKQKKPHATSAASASNSSTPSATRINADATTEESASSAAAVPSSGAAANSAGTVPALCERHGQHRPCDGGTCRKLHMCPHWLQGACRRGHKGGTSCALGHSLSTQHNQRVLASGGITMPTDPETRVALLQRVQRASRVRDVSVYHKLRICIPYNHQEGCPNPACEKIHVCQKYVAGGCVASCPLNLSHKVCSGKNQRRLEALGLHGASDHEVLELLRALHSVRSQPPNQ